MAAKDGNVGYSKEDLESVRDIAKAFKPESQIANFTRERVVKKKKKKEDK